MFLNIELTPQLLSEVGVEESVVDNLTEAHFMEIRDRLRKVILDDTSFSESLEQIATDVSENFEVTFPIFSLSKDDLIEADVDEEILEDLPTDVMKDIASRMIEKVREILTDEDCPFYDELKSIADDEIESYQDDQ